MTAVEWLVLIWMLIAVGVGCYNLGHLNGFKKGIKSGMDIYRRVYRD